MSTSVALSMGQSFLLAGLAAIALIYVAYFRIWVALAVASDLLFAAALAVGVACVVAPDLFDALSGAVIDRSPLPAALDDADARVAALAALPGELVDRALARIGLGDDASDEPTDTDVAGPDETMAAGFDASAPSTGAIEALEALDADPGPFTRSIRPSVESLLALVLRGSALVVSGLLLIVALASRASTTTARRLRDLTDRLEALEAVDRADAPGEPIAAEGAS